MDTYLDRASKRYGYRTFLSPYEVAVKALIKIAVETDNETAHRALKEMGVSAYTYEGRPFEATHKRVIPKYK